MKMSLCEGDMLQQGDLSAMILQTGHWGEKEAGGQRLRSMTNKQWESLRQSSEQDGAEEEKWQLHAILC